jgi:hypothetical protein
MTTARQLRAAALSLREVVAADGEPAVFVVAGREFAALSEDGDDVHLRLPADAVDQMLGEHPRAERLTRGSDVEGVRVPIAAIDGQQLNRWVRLAWKHRAPARLVAAAEAAERAEPGIGDLPRAIGRPATRALVEAGVTSLDELARFSETELGALHGVGPSAVRILREALASRERA